MCSGVSSGRLLAAGLDAVLRDVATLDDEVHFLEGCEVREWVSPDRDDVGSQAGFAGSGFVGDAEDFGVSEEGCCRA